MTIREALHDLIDRLPEEVLGDARAALVTVETPQVLTRIGEEPPLDDEPVTESDLAAMRDAEQRSDYASLAGVRERLASSH